MGSVLQNSDHKGDFGQTISCILEIYSDVISAVIDNLLIFQCLRDKKDKIDFFCYR